MQHDDYRRPYRWRTALQALAVLATLALAFSVRAGSMPIPFAPSTCEIPQTDTRDKPFDATQVADSFSNYTCALQTLPQDITFYRYYSFPSLPDINIGRYLTTDWFDLNSQVIVALALFPFQPNPQFQNFAYYREEVLVKAGTDLYVGTAGPQPSNDVGSCYAGGATQYFFAGENVSSNPSITFSSPLAITKDTRYPNQYGVGDPCNVVPEPDTLMLFGIGSLGMLLVGVRRRAKG